MDAQAERSVTRRVRELDRWPFTLEKWYVDVLSDDGVVLILYLGRVAVLGRPVARFTADLFLPGGVVISGHASVPRVEAGGDTLVFGPAVMEPHRIVWETRGISGELHFAPRYESVELIAPFLRVGDRRLRWTIEIPDADVSGVVRWNGSERKISGRGYRDWVWFDIAPWRFPVRELRWGRAVAGSFASAWVEAQTSGSLIQARWLNGAIVDSEWPVELHESTPLLETAVVDLKGLGLSVFRPGVRLLTGDPHEIKWFTRARIAGTPGFGIHERVVWHSSGARRRQP